MDESEKAMAETRKNVFKARKVTEKYLQSRAEMLFRQQTAVSEIAKFTGGSTSYLEQPEQADEVYSEILSAINWRYTIGYYPTNQAQDGKVRKLKVEVR